MIISSPDKFFVPVITFKNYKEVLDIREVNENFNESLLRNNEGELKNINRSFLEDKIIDHKYNYDINEFQNVSRKLLEDRIPSDKDIEADIYEDISNIGDETIEYYILKYVTAFMIYEKELEAQGCDINREEFLKQIHLYVQDLKDLYNEFMELKKKIKLPLSAADQKGLEDYFVKKVEEIYSKQFANINCKAKEEVIDNDIKGIIDETRTLIKDSIKKINQEVLDKEKDHIIKDEAYFKHLKEIYDEIDKES
jgi:hypothetical protein